MARFKGSQSGRKSLAHEYEVSYQREEWRASPVVQAPDQETSILIRHQIRLGSSNKGTVGIQRTYPESREAHFEPSASLRAEQRHAVETVLGSQDFAINLRGAAGTGKTATLKEINRGLQAAGHEVFAVAPTRNAVEELQKVGFGSGMTISRLLEDQTAQERLRGNMLIVDEAGMVSGRQMEGLLDLARARTRASCSLGTCGRYRVSSPPMLYGFWSESRE